MNKRTIATILVLFGFTLVLTPTFLEKCTGYSAGTANVLCFVDPTNTAFKERLALDARITVSYANDSTYGNYANSLSTFDAFIVCGYLPNNATFIQHLLTNISVSGKGLFMWGGEYPVLQNTDPACIAFKNILPVTFNEPIDFTTGLLIDQGGITSIPITKDSDVVFNELEPTGPGLLQRDLDWPSCPQLKERLACKDALKTTRAATVLAYKAESGRTGPTYEYTKGEPLIAFRNENTARILWISACVGYIDPSFTQPVDANKPFYLWPYFNYFLYQSTLYVAGLNASDIDTYESWPLSPIPHDPSISSAPASVVVMVMSLGVLGAILHARRRYHRT